MSCQELKGNTVKESEGSTTRRSNNQATVQSSKKLARTHETNRIIIAHDNATTRSSTGEKHCSYTMVRSDNETQLEQIRVGNPITQVGNLTGRQGSQTSK